MVAAAEIGEGRRPAPELLGDEVVSPIHAATNPFNPALAKTNLGQQEALLKCFHQRAREKKLMKVDEELEQKLEALKRQELAVRQLQEQKRSLSPR